MCEPLAKRMKVEKTVITDINTYLIEEIVDEMKVSSKNLIPILSDDVTSEIPLKQMLVATVIRKTVLSTVIARLNEILPLPECQYLKRVRNSDVLLCSFENMSAEELGNIFTDNKFVFHDYFQDEIRTIQVTAAPPLTRCQYERALKYWPCNFHPNKKLESLLGGNYFTVEEVRKHRKYMKLAYEIAEIIESKSDKKNRIISGADNVKEIKKTNENKSINKTDRLRLIENKEAIKWKLQELNGVIVVDPTMDHIVAIGYNRSARSPCQHPAMIAIDNVAKSQNGGAWFDDAVAAEEESDENELVLNGVPKMVRDILNATYKDLNFGAVPTKRKCFLPDYGSAPEDDKPSGPYLCTGYDLYTTNEPCLMCSMALVHARIKRVFFAITQDNRGALASICKLHTVPYLNHHFEVFTGFFPDL